MSLSRRTLLRASATASAGLIGGPAILSWMANPAVAAHLKTTREHVAMHLEKAKALDANPQAPR